MPVVDQHRRPEKTHGRPPRPRFCRNLGDDVGPAGTRGIMAGDRGQSGYSRRDGKDLQQAGPPGGERA